MTCPRPLVAIREGLGDSLMSLIDRLYPICRSITGNGVRETLAIIGEHVPLTISEVPSGTNVLDWTVPPEWNINDAYVADGSGVRVIDFRASSLHVVSYSAPVRRRMTLAELRPHLHSLPDQPTLTPYRTSYYHETWGFCLPHERLEALPEDEYEVVIDSTLVPGSLTYAEAVVPGRLSDEVLISTHVCHPSLCDDNLSGIAIAAHLAGGLASGPPPRLSYRFVFAPGTIGALAWLDRNRDRTAHIVAGYTLTCLGDSHSLTYKRTERAGTATNRAAEYTLAQLGDDHDVIDFFPYGYDERQYNAPGFRVPVGSLMRGRHGQFPEYHTSADDLSFLKPEQLTASFDVLSRILGVLERNRTLINTAPYGEPQLGRRGLYGVVGGAAIADAQLAMLWLLNQSDGLTSLLDIAERSGLDFDALVAIADILEEHSLLREPPG